MNIKVPVTKGPGKSVDYANKALAFHLGKKRLFPGMANNEAYHIEVEKDYTYYPYWIGLVWTRKERALPIYPAKEIHFHVVADGIEGNFIVLRNVPKTNQIECPNQKVLPAHISENKLQGEILDEAISARINKQFIFGAPKAKKKQCELIYLPMKHVRIGDKGAARWKDYYVNVYTGEVKTV